MNYLVFGGEGFIGRHLIDYLVKEKGNREDRVFSLDIVRKSNYSNFQYVDVRHAIDLDLKDASDSIIFNLAAVHVTPGHPDREYFETNIRGAENIVRFAERAGITKVVFTSSIAPYGASEESKSEETLPMPNTPYGISKLVAEHVFQTWWAENKGERRLSIVRPGVVFGKGEGGNFTRLYNAQKKGFFFYPGRSDTLKACVYVKDVVRILCDTIGYELPHNYSMLNLTYYPVLSIKEICNTIAEVTEVSRPSIVVPGLLLKSVAFVLYVFGRLVGKKINGIHPDRVSKLMISTNIDGRKLEQGAFKLRYTLRNAIEDWKNTSNGKDLL